MGGAGAVAGDYGRGHSGRVHQPALLTAQAIANDGLPLIGWVANRINLGLAHYAEIIDVLSKSCKAWPAGGRTALSAPRRAARISALHRSLGFSAVCWP